MPDPERPPYRHILAMLTSGFNKEARSQALGGNDEYGRHQQSTDPAAVWAFSGIPLAPTDKREAASRTTAIRRVGVAPIVDTCGLDVSHSPAGPAQPRDRRR